MQTDTLHIAPGCTPCGRCVPVCPEKALVVKAPNRPVTVSSACTGCGWCLTACPDKLLSLVPKPETPVTNAFEEAMARYGEPVVYAIVPKDDPPAPPKAKARPKRKRS